MVEDQAKLYPTYDIRFLGVECVTHALTNDIVLKKYTEVVLQNVFLSGRSSPALGKVPLGIDEKFGLDIDQWFQRYADQHDVHT
jgi:hypothetical protein